MVVSWKVLGRWTVGNQNTVAKPRAHVQEVHKTRVRPLGTATLLRTPIRTLRQDKVQVVDPSLQSLALATHLADLVLDDLSQHPGLDLKNPLIAEPILFLGSRGRQGDEQSGYADCMRPQKANETLYLKTPPPAHIGCDGLWQDPTSTSGLVLNQELAEGAALAGKLEGLLPRTLPFSARLLRLPLLACRRVCLALRLRLRDSWASKGVECVEPQETPKLARSRGLQSLPTAPPRRHARPCWPARGTSTAHG